MPVSSQDFRRALGTFPSGVVVVTSLCPKGTPVGVTISAFSSLSLDPPLVLICLDNKSNHINDLCEGDVIVNVLADDQAEISQRFAQPLEDRFEGISWTEGRGGVPALSGVAGRLACTVQDVLDGGDHKIIVLAVHETQTDLEKRPLVYLKGGYGTFTPA